MNSNINNLFVCYDKKQRNYFRDLGFNDILYGLHPKTFMKFWVFIRNEEFNMAFEKWLSNKNT